MGGTAATLAACYLKQQDFSEKEIISLVHKKGYIDIEWIKQEEPTFI